MCHSSYEWGGVSFEKDRLRFHQFTSTYAPTYNCVSVHRIYIALEPSLDGKEPTTFKAVVLSLVTKGVSRSCRTLSVSGCARTIPKLLCDRQNPVGLSQHCGLNHMTVQDRRIRTARRTRRRHSLGMRHGLGRRRENCINDRELLGV